MKRLIILGILLFSVTSVKAGILDISPFNILAGDRTATGDWTFSGHTKLSSTTIVDGSSFTVTGPSNLKAVIATTLDTGQGANELYDMDQNVLTASTPSFSALVVVGTMTTNGNYPIEGYSTGPNVLRSVGLLFQPGSIAGDGPTGNINCTNLGSGFNTSSITNGSNISSGTASGSFSLSTDGKSITLNLTEDVVGILSTDIIIHDLNSSSTTEMYVMFPAVTSNNLVFRTIKRGTSAIVDWRTILDAGDIIEIVVVYVTSS